MASVAIHPCCNAGVTTSFDWIPPEIFTFKHLEEAQSNRRSEGSGVKVKDAGASDVGGLTQTQALWSNTAPKHQAWEKQEGRGYGQGKNAIRSGSISTICKGYRLSELGCISQHAQ